jgi:hypothetical protein
VADPDITVISGEPIEGHELGRRDAGTWMWWIASAGGLTGLAFGTWLTWMTETAWPLPTGNMPIVAWWPNLIVMFELTMLGGILAAVVTLPVTAGLPTFKQDLRPGSDQRQDPRRRRESSPSTLQRSAPSSLAARRVKRSARHYSARSPPPITPAAYSRPFVGGTAKSPLLSAISPGQSCL